MGIFADQAKEMLEERLAETNLHKEQCAHRAEY
jgi:hypothetical protein